MNPKYVRGGYKNEKDGLDCSGFIYLGGKRAGLNVQRTTAQDMANGSYGWSHSHIKRLCDVETCDLVFWDWGKSSVQHVGAVVRGSTSGLLEVAHASVHRGVISEEFKGYLTKDIVEVVRLDQLR